MEHLIFVILYAIFALCAIITRFVVGDGLIMFFAIIFLVVTSVIVVGVGWSKSIHMEEKVVFLVESVSDIVFLLIIIEIMIVLGITSLTTFNSITFSQKCAIILLILSYLAMKVCGRYKLYIIVQNNTSDWLRKKPHAYTKVSEIIHGVNSTETKPQEEEGDDSVEVVVNDDDDDDDN